MSFAEYFLKQKLVRQAASEVAEAITKHADKATKAAESASITNQEIKSFAEQLGRAIKSPCRDGFVSQTQNATQQTVRHAGDTFVQVPKTGGLTFAPRTRTQSTQTIQTKQPQATRPVTESFDDILLPENQALNEIDDFWNERMSQHVNDYLDDVYKSIDDSLGLGW